MSALTEEVAREHVLTYQDEATGDWVCNCGLSIPADLEHMEHIAEVTERATEQAVRANVAAEIRANLPEIGRHINVMPYRDGKYQGMTRAARIAEGKRL